MASSKFFCLTNQEISQHEKLDATPVPIIGHWFGDSSVPVWSSCGDGVDSRGDSSGGNLVDYGTHFNFRDLTYPNRDFPAGGRVEFGNKSPMLTAMN